MDIEDSPIVRRDQTLRAAFIAALAFVFVANLVTTHRPIFLSERPVFVVGPKLESSGGFSALSEALDDYGLHVVKQDHRSLVDLLSGPTQGPQQKQDAMFQAARFGYSGFETVLLGLPLWLSADRGSGIGFDGPGDYTIVPVEAVNWGRIGVAPPSGSGLWWAKLGHFWGWLFFAAVGLYIRFELLAASHRRDEAGII